ncbi:hypothetical protein HPA02_08430 [Bisbaumannia pacifica]|uniref:Tip attachment protein J central straight fiber domain-containing protein n=1 Tax=Bisbaumannia pacifica TaxID=77098 RepID=A0A510XDF9_9GAMM|nr:DUF1983 domain-containing protein [Halomonas pacifica]GEK46560.1 hypothetical protein HPA02_08430 [Halomonas pacifica]
MTNNRRKTLPPIDPATDRKLRPILEALKEIQETGEGVRGDPLDRKLTVRDLVEAGLARLRPGSQSDIGPVDDDPIDNDPPGSTLIPPRPTGFNAVGSFGYIVLSWGIPRDLYANHAFTTIYRGETDNFANAEMIGRDTGMMYTDHIREVDEHGVGFYYWITFTNTDDVEGPANATAGTYAEVIPDLGFLMDRLSSEIDDSKLAQSFLERLPGYQETVSGSGDIYTLTLNQNGYISGLGAYNDGTTSDFTIIADRFWVAPPNSTGRRKPFIIQNGNVYIDTAFIREASIQEGQLGPISFGKITDASGSPVTTVAGKLKGALIEAENLRVAEAAKFYGDVYSNNYRQGVSGWAIRQDGYAEFNTADFRGLINFADLRVSGNPVNEHVSGSISAGFVGHETWSTAWTWSRLFSESTSTGHIILSGSYVFRGRSTGSVRVDSHTGTDNYAAITYDYSSAFEYQLQARVDYSSWVTLQQGRVRGPAGSGALKAYGNGFATDSIGQDGDYGMSFYAPLHVGAHQGSFRAEFRLRVRPTKEFHYAKGDGAMTVTDTIEIEHVNGSLSPASLYLYRF